jgi:hypothetical protein
MFLSMRIEVFEVSRDDFCFVSRSCTTLYPTIHRAKQAHFISHMTLFGCHPGGEVLGKPREVQHFFCHYNLKLDFGAMCM